MSRSDQDRRNEYNRALYILLAKLRCRGQALSCFLDEQPSELIPRHARHVIDERGLERSLVVNSSFRYAPRGEPPPELRDRAPLVDGFLKGFPLAWIENAGAGIWTPFWARNEWVPALESLRADQPVPPTLPRHMQQTLAAVNVLVPPEREQEQRRTWERIVQEAETQFRTLGYAVVRDLISPVFLGAMRHYYRALVAGGRLPRGDDQVAERYRLHSEPVAMFFHGQLSRLVGQIAGEPVKPSYLYFASYPSGSALPKHVDRIQCEFSISLLIDYSPDPSGPCGWPLFLEHADLPGGVVSADLGIGDAVFYRGRRLAHYRDRLPEGHQSSSIFLHYLRQDYIGDTF
jgi:hypothetical protein